MKTIINNKTIVIPLVLLVGVFLGWLLFAPSSPEHVHEDDDVAEVTTWTCSMHPSVRQPSPGKCPICGMELIPLENTGPDDPMAVIMSPTAIKLANIQTLTVGLSATDKVVRLNGKVQAAERRVASQTAHVPGRIERLLVNFTGEYVTKGRTLAYVYSPELLTAQQELFEAYKIRDIQPALYAAAREKMRNWKISDDQIDGIIANGKVTEQFPIVADVSGYVLKRNVSVGDHVVRGQGLFEVVDLSRVWVLFDLYEREMAWVKKGSPVEFSVQSVPGEKIKGTISFIDPIINPATRVAAARLEISNPGQVLKPEMFVTGIISSSLSAQQEITVPKTAVMWTGERSIVYVMASSDEGVTFRLREIELGPSVGDQYVVRSGLTLGEEVVVHGTFTVDAAAQLAGKPSMMSPDRSAPPSGHQHGDSGAVPESTTDYVPAQFAEKLKQLLDPYLVWEEALVKENAPAAHDAVKNLSASLAGMNPDKFGSHQMWVLLYDQMNTALAKARSANDIEIIREAFSAVSDTYFKAIQEFEVEGLHAYYQYCPMAFNNKGAYWISKSEDIKNPYFGSRMLTCGEVIQEIK
jgi:Cu(I)/Ag(I) efflux system membrane fusion protein